jgi:hypothetical protein
MEKQSSNLVHKYIDSDGGETATLLLGPARVNTELVHRERLSVKFSGSNDDDDDDDA